MSQKIPCCMGCAVYGHERCTCIPPAKRVVEIPLPVAKRLLSDAATDRDRRVLRNAVVAEDVA